MLTVVSKNDHNGEHKCSSPEHKKIPACKSGDFRLRKLSSQAYLFKMFTVS